MNCKEFSFLLDAMTDRPLSGLETDALRAHAAECPDCAALLRMLEDCRKTDAETEIPAAFSAAWRQRIREEKALEGKSRKRRAWQGYLAAAAMLIVVLGGALIARDRLPRLTAPAEQAKRAESSADEAVALGWTADSAAWEESAAPENAYAPMMEDACEMEAAYEAEEAYEAKEAYEAEAAYAMKASATAAPAPTAMQMKAESASAARRESAAEESLPIGDRQLSKDTGDFLASFWPYLAGIVLAAAVAAAVIKKKKKKKE